MKVVDPKKVEEKKHKILDISEAIINEQGLEGLSIRKIAQRMNQTPGIIYHYFENKEQILSAIVQRGYHEIVAIIKVEDVEKSFEYNFQNNLTSYMKAMTLHKDVFLLLLQSKDKKLQEATSILNRNHLNRRGSMNLLMKNIQEGIDKKIFQPLENIDIYAKLLWCSMFGLIERIIIEEISEKEGNQYIDAFINMTVQSLKGK